MVTTGKRRDRSREEAWLKPCEGLEADWRIHTPVSRVVQGIDALPGPMQQMLRALGRRPCRATLRSTCPGCKSRQHGPFPSPRNAGGLAPCQDAVGCRAALD